MAVFGNEDESAYQSLLATIRQNLNVNTNSNIDGLNRDDSKAEGPVHKSSHKFSLALPVVDFKELGEGFQRIGMTAREINQKMQGTFESAKQQATAPEEKANIEEVQAKYNDIVEKIEKSNLPEDKKVEIAMRIALLFSENEPDSGQYLIQEKLISELSEKGKFTPIRLGDDDQWASTYSPNGGAILAIEISVSYGEDTYKYMAQYFDAATINDLRQTQSKWTKFMKDYGPGAIDFCEGFTMSAVETLLAVKDGFVMIGGLYIDITDGTFAKDSAAFRSLGWEDQLKIIDHVAAEMLQGMYEGLRESLASPKGWGGIAGDIAMGAGALKFAKEAKAARKLGGSKLDVKCDCTPISSGLPMGEKAGGRFSHPIVGRQPMSISEELVMMEAQKGGGSVFNMKAGIKDPKYQAPGWQKMQLTHDLPNGKGQINIHYMKNELTGEMDQFKFKDN